MSDNQRLAVITGASAGLGAVFASRLAARGYDLLLAARRRQRLEELKREIEAGSKTAVSIAEADLSEPAALEEFAADLERRERVDLLVNNAGFGTVGYFWETDYQKQEQMHRLHIGATMRLTRAVLGGMVTRGSGAIINVASVAGFLRSAGNTSYCATKGWMCDFTEGLRLELDSVKSPVVVQALCPGFTYTEFHDVMGVDRSRIGKSWWMPAGFVVDESLKALQTGQVFVIPGWRYKVLVAIASRLPAAWRMRMERRSAPRRGAAR